MGVRAWAICAVSLLTASGCQKAMESPMTAGVCWRLAPAMNGQHDFKPFATDVANLETCAAKLEGQYLAHGQPLVGGFQGRIIYVTAQDVTVAPNDKAQPYRVFTPQQRAKVDEGYRTLKARE
jgi:hypothetical protein